MLDSLVEGFREAQQTMQVCSSVRTLFRDFICECAMNEFKTNIAKFVLKQEFCVDIIQMSSSRAPSRVMGHYAAEDRSLWGRVPTNRLSSVTTSIGKVLLVLPKFILLLLWNPLALGGLLLASRSQRAFEWMVYFWIFS